MHVVRDWDWKVCVQCHFTWIDSQLFIRSFHEYDGIDMQPLPWAHPPGKEHIPVFQDESTFHTNENRLHCRWDNGPISELPTETELTARAYHYHRPDICYEFDMQKPSIPL